MLDGVGDAPGLPVPPFIPSIDWAWTVRITVVVVGALPLIQLVAMVLLIRTGV